jgi:uncharacterized membrane protein
MKTLQIPALMLTALCAAFLLFLAYSAPLLPERMASHFGGSGQANGWMNRDTDLCILGTVGVGMPLLFFILGLVIRLVPDQFINLPHREYWLSPEQRAATSEFISRQMLWMGCLMILFLAGIHYLTILANRLTPARLPMDLFLALLGGFLAAVAGWVIHLIRHFAKVPPARS